MLMMSPFCLLLMLMVPPFCLLLLLMVPTFCLLLLSLWNAKLAHLKSEATFVLCYSTKIEMKKSTTLKCSPVNDMSACLLVIVIDDPAYKFFVKKLYCKFRLAPKKNL